MRIFRRRIDENINILRKPIESVRRDRIAAYEGVLNTTCVQ